MVRILIFLTAFLLTLSNNGNMLQTFASVSGNQADTNAGKSKIKLFNGINLDGWYTFLKGKGKNVDPNKVFTVKNGVIVISGEEYGCIH